MTVFADHLELVLQCGSGEGDGMSLGLRREARAEHVHLGRADEDICVNQLLFFNYGKTGKNTWDLTVQWKINSAVIPALLWEMYVKC